jgi:hypothetical protein
MKKNVSRTVGNAATVSSLAKNTKANSLRTAKAVARFGKAARHPVCQAGLQLWQLETEISKLTDNAALFAVEVLNSAEQQKKQVIKLYRETRNTKVAADASLLLGKIKALLSKGRACYDAMVKYAAFLLQLKRYASLRFEREYKAADAPARKALREVKKRWKENPDGLSSLEHKILKILQDKVVSGAGAKGGL